MRVIMEKSTNDWRLILVPEDDIERSIIKTKNGNTVSLVTDMRSHGSHIPECLVISGVPSEIIVEETPK